MTFPPPIPESGHARCRQCGADIPPTAVSCPACHALVHAGQLKSLADTARAAAERGDVSGQLEAWRVALTLLPPESAQFQTISERVQALSRSLSDPSGAPPRSEPAADGAKKAWSGGAIAAAALLIWKFKAVGVFLLTKGKLLLFGLSKGTTFFSMLAALGVYWTIWGWKFALGFVLSIYIHEMGHVAAMKRFGIAATAPMFIPGFGAFIRMKQHPATVQEEARIGLGGPIWGFGAAAGCFLLYVATDQPYWAALTHTGAMINLFNLLPVWQLDGGHAFKALNRTERWIATGVTGAALLMTGEGLLVLIAILAAVQAFRQAPNVEGDRTALIQFAGLVVALGLLMKMPVPGAAMTTPDIYYKRSRFSTRLPWDRLYTASHFWVLEAEPGRWRVGLTKFAARMLGDIVDLEFEVPDGGVVSVGEVIGSLEGFKARTELYSVLQGTFLGANPALATSLDVLDSDRYGAGWLYAVEGAPDPGALDAGGYAAVLDATIDKMRDHL